MSKPESGRVTVPSRRSGGEILRTSRLHLGSRDADRKVFDGVASSVPSPKSKLNRSSSSLGLSRFPAGVQVRLILPDLDVRRTSLLVEASSNVVFPNRGVIKCPHEAALLKETIDAGRGRCRAFESEKRRVSAGTSSAGEKTGISPVLAFRPCTVLLLAFAVGNDRFEILEVRPEGASVLTAHANIDRGRVRGFREGGRLTTLSADGDKDGSKGEFLAEGPASENDGGVLYMTARRCSGSILVVLKIGTCIVDCGPESKKAAISAGSTS